MLQAQESQCQFQREHQGFLTEFDILLDNHGSSSSLSPSSTSTICASSFSNITDKSVIMEMLAILNKRRDELRLMDKHLFDMIAECLVHLNKPAAKHKKEQDIISTEEASIRQEIAFRDALLPPPSPSTIPIHEELAIDLTKLNKAAREPELRLPNKNDKRLKLLSPGLHIKKRRLLAAIQFDDLGSDGCSDSTSCSNTNSTSDGTSESTGPPVEIDRRGIDTGSDNAAIFDMNSAAITQVCRLPSSFNDVMGDKSDIVSDSEQHWPLLERRPKLKKICSIGTVESCHDQFARQQQLFNSTLAKLVEDERGISNLTDHIKPPNIYLERTKDTANNRQQAAMLNYYLPKTVSGHQPSSELKTQPVVTMSDFEGTKIGYQYKYLNHLDPGTTLRSSNELPHQQHTLCLQTSLANKLVHTMQQPDASGADFQPPLAVTGYNHNSFYSPYHFQTWQQSATLMRYLESSGQLKHLHEPQQALLDNSLRLTPFGAHGTDNLGQPRSLVTQMSEDFRVGHRKHAHIAPAAIDSKTITLSSYSDQMARYQAPKQQQQQSHQNVQVALASTTQLKSAAADSLDRPVLSTALNTTEPVMATFCTISNKDLAPVARKMSFRCHVCQSCFEDRHRMQQHLSIHLNLHSSWFEERTIKETMAQYELKRGDYLCQRCQIRFETTSEFDKHMHLHADKPHQCDLCSVDGKFVSFRYFRQLLTHFRSHCFLYSCKFAPECRQTANRKDYLKLHILKHHLNNKLPVQYTICCH